MAEETKAADAGSTTKAAEGTEIKATATATETKVVDGATASTTEKDSKDAAVQAAATKKVPDKYELKIQKDSQLDAGAQERIAAYAKQQGLSNEEAQALLDREHDAVSSFATRQADGLKTKVNEWIAEAQNDKEIGGEAFGKNAELAKRVVERFGSESLKKALNETGLGNHPELVRTFVRIGKQMSEDSLVQPGAQAGGKKKIEDVFYPST